MKLRHAAALALVGWYLMAPPIHLENSKTDGQHTMSTFSVDPNAPLREWKQVQAQEFDSEADCRRTISNGCHREIEANGPSYLEGPLCGAVCVSTDDPRLKSK